MGQGKCRGIYNIGYLDNMKLPNYFLKQELITENTMLDEFYYETTLNAKIYHYLF